MKQKDIDNILKANKKLDWVKRLYEKDTPSIVLPGQEYPSTHYMESSDNLVYPTIIRNADGKLEYLGNKARDYAIKTNTAIKLSSEEDANWFGENYKKGTNVLKQFKKGGKVEPIYTDNPKDKRLKAYNDSLSLYKKYPNNKYAIESTFDNLNSVNNNVQSGIDSKTLYPNLDFANNNKIKPTKVEWAQTGGGNYTEEELKKGNWVHYNVNGSGANGVTRYFTYKKPVQPVIYKKKIEEEKKSNNSKIEPIYVDNPNDKRLQAYNDSLALSKYTHNTLKWDANDAGMKAFINLEKLNGVLPSAKNNDKYKKPVQPIIYKKKEEVKVPIPKKKFTFPDEQVEQSNIVNENYKVPEVNQQQGSPLPDYLTQTVKTPNGMKTYKRKDTNSPWIEQDFEKGGIVQAWVQKFTNGGMAAQQNYLDLNRINNENMEKAGQTSSSGSAGVGMMGSSGMMGGMKGGGNGVGMIMQGISQGISGTFSALDAQKKATEQQGQQNLQNAYQMQQMNDLKAMELEQQQPQPYNKGGIVQAWIQKFLPGGEVQQLNYPTTQYPNWYMNQNEEFNPYSQYNINPQLSNITQIANTSVPNVQTNFPQNIGTNYQTFANASQDQINKDNKMADEMMGKTPIDKPKGGGFMSTMQDYGKAVDAIGSTMGDFSNRNGDVRNSAWQTAKKGAAESNPVFGFFHSIDEGLQSVGKLAGGNKGQKGVQFFSDPIGFILNLGSGIKEKEDKKREQQLEYDDRNKMPTIKMPSHYGNYMAKYGANPKMMEQRVIDDIYSDFDKYMKKV